MPRPWCCRTLLAWLSTATTSAEQRRGSCGGAAGRCRHGCQGRPPLGNVVANGHPLHELTVHVGVPNVHPLHELVVSGELGLPSLCQQRASNPQRWAPSCRTWSRSQGWTRPAAYHYSPSVVVPFFVFSGSGTDPEGIRFEPAHRTWIRGAKRHTRRRRPHRDLMTSPNRRERLHSAGHQQNNNSSRRTSRHQATSKKTQKDPHEQ